MVLKVNLKSKILNIGNVSKIFIYFGTIIVFIIISNSLRTSQDNEFFIKKYDNLKNLVSKKFQNHNSQINYFKHLKKPVEIIFWYTLYPRELEIVKETCTGARLGGSSKPESSPCVMMIPPTKRVLIAHDVCQTCCRCP
ncbi:MAG: hypothetical protein Q8840_02165, partial [Sweet potato little leaf phytoplasma]|nr:hypothetical protein [Sweet potato little leaf phytoplasma]